MAARPGGATAASQVSSSPSGPALPSPGPGGPQRPLTQPGYPGRQRTTTEGGRASAEPPGARRDTTPPPEPEQRRREAEARLLRLRGQLAATAAQLAGDGDLLAETEFRLRDSRGATVTARARLLRSERRMLELVEATTRARYRVQEAGEAADELAASHGRWRARTVAQAAGASGGRHLGGTAAVASLAEATRRHRELAALCEERRARLAGGGARRRLQEEAEALRQRLSQGERDVAGKRAELEEQRRGQARAATALEVERKRCDAVLRRLRGQVADAQSQRGQRPMQAPHEPDGIPGRPPL